MRSFWSRAATNLPFQVSKSASMSSSSSPSPLSTTGVAPRDSMAAYTRLPTAQKCSYCLLPRPKTAKLTPCSRQQQAEPRCASDSTYLRDFLPTHLRDFLPKPKNWHRKHSVLCLKCALSMYSLHTQLVLPPSSAVQSIHRLLRSMVMMLSVSRRQT